MSNIRDVLATTKAERSRTVDQIRAKQAEIDILKSRRDELDTDILELQAFMDTRPPRPA